MLKSTTAENCALFYVGYPVVFISLKDNKTVSGFSQIKQYILFFYWRNVSAVNWPKSVVKIKKVTCIAVFDWSQKLFWCPLENCVLPGQNWSPANALRGDSPVCHLSWRKCRRCRRWLSWIWRFYFQPISLYSHSLACRSNFYIKWQPFISLLSSITVL